VTAPLPLPLAPLVTVIHDELLTAVQPHPGPAVMATVPLPPPGPKLSRVGEIEYVQVAAPLWFTVNVLLAIVIVPEREDEPVLTSTEYETLPLPLPLAPAVT
jgi:hypothetical protein